MKFHSSFVFANINIVIILQFLGLQGDYFYIIEIGTFNVIVNGQVVAILEEGRSFGELALLYNCPRAATVRATKSCLVYSLDRDTFRNTLANSSFSKVSYYRVIDRNNCREVEKLKVLGAV